jgi:UDP-N-acetylglucosamine transferase subunit ALG13
MIFITVGTDQPFDRMMKVVDAWARDNKRRDVFAQVGVGAWKPIYMDSVDFLEPPEYKRRFDEASLIISHAGMGTILSALLRGKPILVMPKLASLGEHRNEHQTATARRMMEMGRVNVAFDVSELRQKLDQLDQLSPHERILPVASGPLIEGLRSFIFGA